MSTRGTIGFRVNNTDHLVYNHSDSYPEGLGLEILAFCKKNADTDEKIDKLRRKAVKLKDSKTFGEPTPEVIKKLAKWTDLRVSEQSTKDWYCLLRKAQGNLSAYLQAGFMPHGNDFITDSLFCEWAYIINLDTNKLEVYKGFQEKSHEKGRYASWRPPGGWTRDGRDPNYWSGYYACALIAEFNLKRLPAPLNFLRKVNKKQKDA